MDVHVAAWLHELVTLSGGNARDKGTEAISRLEEHVGGGFALTKVAVPPAVPTTPRPNPITSGTATETATAAKLAILWDALSERLSWQKVFGGVQ